MKWSSPENLMKGLSLIAFLIFLGVAGSFFLTQSRRLLKTTPEVVALVPIPETPNLNEGGISTAELLEIAAEAYAERLGAITSYNDAVLTHTQIRASRYAVVFKDIFVGFVQLVLGFLLSVAGVRATAQVFDNRNRLKHDKAPESIRLFF